MLSLIYDFILHRHKLVRSAAVFVWQACCTILAIGVASTVATAVMEVSVRRLSGTGASVHLAQLLPNWPTWWIPESAVGFGAYLLLMLMAYMTNDLAKQMDRQFSH